MPSTERPRNRVKQKSELRCDQHERKSDRPKNPGKPGSSSKSPNTRLVKSAMRTTEQTPSERALDALRDHPDGQVRTARKQWRCRCADPVRYWQVVGHYTNKYGSESWSSRSANTEAEAQAMAEAQVGKVAAWDMTQDPAVPSAHYERVEVVPYLNPNHRPDCLGDINVGDKHFEYRGESGAPWERGYRYCAVCAVAVWSKSANRQPSTASLGSLLP